MRTRRSPVPRIPNLVPRVLWLFGQRMSASRDSGVLEFCYRKISAVKQWKSLQGSQLKNLNFFEFPRVSTGAHPLTKRPEDSGYEIVGYHTYLWTVLYACEHIRMRSGRVSLQERVELVPTVANMHVDLCWLTFNFPQLLSMRTSISPVPRILYIPRNSSICVWTYTHAFRSCESARESWTCSYCCGHACGPVVINLHFPPTSKHAHKCITCSLDTIHTSE